MQFTWPTPSLQRLALVRIDAHLWCQPDILKLVANKTNWFKKGYLPEELRPWLHVGDKVKEKALALPLPELLIKQLHNFVYHLGLEILYWFACHYKPLNRFVPLNSLSRYFSWTALGSLDHKKTAELIVKDEGLDVVYRYKFACITCLENEAGQLWARIPARRKQALMKMVSFLEYSVFSSGLIGFWTWTLTDPANSTSRIEVYNRGENESVFLFKRSLRVGNRAACDFLFDKLNQLEKDDVVTWMLDEKRYHYKRPPNCDLIHYLTQSDDDILRFLFRISSYSVLGFMLLWPRQTFFLEMVKREWPSFVRKRSYREILNRVTAHIRLGFKDYNYCQLFLEVLLLVPEDVKKCYLDSKWCCEVFSKVAMLHDESPSEERIELVAREMYRKMSGILTEESEAISDKYLFEFQREMEEDEDVRCRCENLLELL